MKYLIVFSMLLMLTCSKRIIHTHIIETFTNLKSGQKEKTVKDIQPHQQPIFGRNYQVEIDTRSKDPTVNLDDYKISFSFEEYKFATPMIKFVKGGQSIQFISIIFKHTSDEIISMSYNVVYHKFPKEISQKISKVIVIYGFEDVGEFDSQSSQLFLYTSCCILTFLVLIIVAIRLISENNPKKYNF